jgi:hypothetical protein
MKNKKSLMQIRGVSIYKGIPIYQLSVRRMAMHDLHSSENFINGNIT